MPFSPNSSSCPKKLSSEYQLDTCGNVFGYSSILEKSAILGQPPRACNYIKFYQINILKQALGNNSSVKNKKSPPREGGF